MGGGRTARRRGRRECGTRARSRTGLDRTGLDRRNKGSQLLSTGIGVGAAVGARDWRGVGCTDDTSALWACLVCLACLCVFAWCKRHDMAWRRVNSPELCTLHAITQVFTSLLGRCTAERCSGATAALGLILVLILVAVAKPSLICPCACRCKRALLPRRRAGDHAMHAVHQRQIRQSIWLPGIDGYLAWPVVARRTESGPLHQGRADREGLIASLAHYLTGSLVMRPLPPPPSSSSSLPLLPADQ